MGKNFQHEDEPPEEDVELQPNNNKPKKNIEKITAWQHFREFSDNTSVHGIKYIGEDNRSPLERLCWLILFITSFIICGFLISKMWNKWNISPVIVSFSETSTPIWNIPFPAVTICPESKINPHQFNFTDFVMYKQKTLSEKQAQDLNKALLICTDDLILNKSLTVENDAIDFLQNVAPPFVLTILHCELFQKVVNCSKLFKPILTEDGICYTFNMLDSNYFKMDDIYMEVNEDLLFDFLMDSNETFDLPEIFADIESVKIDIEIKSNQKIWSLDTGYIENPPDFFVPIKTNGASKKYGLKIYTNIVKDTVDYICTEPTEGFKIILHNPAETPRIDLPHFYLPLKQGVNVAVKPDMMTTSETLWNYSPEQRQCFFPSERQLRYHSVYTQNNCKLECIAEAILKKCGCVKFYMPRDDATKICGAGMNKCAEEAELLAIKKEATSDPNKCNCLPACTSLQYDVETSQVSLNLKAMYNAMHMSAVQDQFGTSILTIYFKESQFFTSQRSELYGLTDFLANCGGLLGLCMGFSILSLMEIIYFLSIRPLYIFGHTKVVQKRK